MKPSPILLYGLTAFLFAAACSWAGAQSSNRYLGIPVAEITSERDQLLRLWYPRLIDTLNGGYWTNFEADWSRPDDQQKFLITQARGLWTAARGVRALPAYPELRRAADHGFQFLTQSMWDKTSGGFYQYFPDPALPKESTSYKMAYGNAFALFALAEYARINPDPNVLNWVRKSFQWMEEKLHDPVKLGYFNMVLPSGIDPETEQGRALIERIGWSPWRGKDQNTSIHLLEAFTTTYEVLPEPLVRERLEEMLRLVRDTMTHPDGYLHLHFTADWKPVVYRDSSRAFILKNQGKDHQSFGHDIETAYLLIDAATALYGRPDTKTLQVAKKLVDHTLTYGFDRKYYGLFDRGYRFRPDLKMEIIDRKKAWWAQYEAWHALALMHVYFPGESQYSKGFRRMWAYIQKELRDPQNGGCYGTGLDITPAAVKGRKAHAWKGAYHDGRSLMQVVDYASGQIPPK